MENFIVTNVTKKEWLTNRNEVSELATADSAEEETDTKQIKKIGLGRFFLF
ncbi:MAG: hypothetical protein WC238_01840 [Parcubacteria group bacterium]